MIRQSLSILALLAGMASIAIPHHALANVIINSTRLIYPAQKKEITIKTHNPDSVPALVQVWIDEGDPQIRAQDSNAPFVITPPLIRMEGKGGQTFRIIFIPNEKQLPEDRESIFYFNLLDIPPMPQAAEGDPPSYMQLAYRNRLKLFYRPPGLPQPAHEAAEMLTWSLVQADGKPGLQVQNPSAYHVSFNGIQLIQGNRHYAVEGDMLAPGQSSILPIAVPANLTATEPLQVDFNWINDYGAQVKQRSNVTR